MLRASRLLAASLAAVTLALPAVADARVVSASFEARFEIVATCSVSVARSVDVACASPGTPYLLDSSAAPSQRSADLDARRVTVYF
ncbi:MULTISPECIES: hypothetical protein [Massilia]|uniref:Spore coat protein U domain-containing protein n=1 Tax=Massilia aurea TaxID=373040 RepID=A0A422QLN2_9BURK|nr:MULTISPECIES: hypothetical protein [Massilia]MDY0962895.1 hypothetical protein [Massilia sp. CFBP9026]RNF30910.1 hypothetical protein NM04_10025 [Massilia aurea]